MGRSILIAVLALAALPAAAPAASLDRVARHGATVRLAACTTDADATGRAATFAAQMVRMPGTRRMAMRFELQERRNPYRPWKRVAVPGWGEWERAQPGRPAFLFTRRVQDLLAPAEYRAVVRFRWYDASKHVLRSLRRASRVCRQPDPRPDLEIGGVRMTALGDGDSARYEVVVRNSGTSAAGAFALALWVAGAEQPPVSGGPLGAGAAEVVTITAPRCAPGSRLHLVVDAGGAVDEAEEGDNAVGRPCPPAR